MKHKIPLSPRLYHALVTVLCLILLVLLSIGFLLGRKGGLPQTIRPEDVKTVILTYGGKTRVLTPANVRELEALTAKTAELSPRTGFSPLRPRREIATMTYWNYRTKYENRYLFMEGSVLRTQGLALPYYYRLYEDGGLLPLIKALVEDNDSWTSPPGRDALPSLPKLQTPSTP
ncbi:hypothetical protein ABB02_00340 [Clostridiaceae bacterium JG1575]|nr:hypothetical protein ABB02_00340 [Clostridiaceae bacterium JG1575]